MHVIFYIYLLAAVATSQIRGNATKKITLVLLTFILLVGLLSIHRATLKISDPKIISGKVIYKKISYYTSVISGRHYCLSFESADRKDKIAINLGTKSQAENDSAFYLIDTGKTYKFYLNPTIPTIGGVKWGIDKIDFNDAEVYKKSNKLNLYEGTFIILISLFGMAILHYA